MKKGVHLFTVFNIKISVDYTWLIVFTLVAWSLAYGYFPNSFPGLTQQAYLFLGIISSLLLFGCVLLHELGHSVVSNRLGLPVKEITLFIFGGIANLTKEPEDPWDELRIALAGPMVSVMLAIIFKFLSVMTQPMGEIESAPLMAHAVFSILFTVNVVILIFNMIPGFPLDGGRVLRALWWAATKDLKRATALASSVGKAFAIVLMVLGLAELLTGQLIHGLWAILIGTFLMQAAQSGMSEVLLKTDLSSITVADIMVTDVKSIPSSITVEAAVEDYFLHLHFVSFPVTEGNEIVGVLSFRDIKSRNKAAWPMTYVKDIMEVLTENKIIKPDVSAYDALHRMALMNTGIFLVMDNNKLLGVISRRDIMKTFELKELLG
ncbi:MAG: site-2 protease family protein [Deltaproteobacteria bacterium]|nr:site-2 protease family protein [Deltaproteobacteria bacterium]